MNRCFNRQFFNFELVNYFLSSFVMSPATVIDCSHYRVLENVGKWVVYTALALGPAIRGVLKELFREGRLAVLVWQRGLSLTAECCFIVCFAPRTPKSGRK